MKGNILILSAGRRVSLVNAFKKEAALTDASIKIFAADANPALSSACQVSHNAFRLPRVSEKSYLPELERISVENKIKIIIPTIDTELLLLSHHRDDFEKKGIYIMSPNHEFVRMCRNKRLTHEYFLLQGIEVAKEIDPSSPVYPLFAKPVDGSSSNHIYYAPEAAYLPPFVLNNAGFLLLEYLDRKQYDEFTVDLYFDRNGSLSCFVPRLRIETRGGEVSKGITSKNFPIDRLRETFNIIPGARGCVTMQFFLHRDMKQLKGIEINPRFGGGYPLSYLAGANFPGWIIKEYLYSEPIEWFDKWEDNLLMLRYDDEILIHGFKAD